MALIVMTATEKETADVLSNRLAVCSTESQRWVVLKIMEEMADIFARHHRSKKFTREGFLRACGHLDYSEET